MVRFQQKCDYYASQGAPHFRRLIVATVMSHVIATLIATATVAYALHLLVLPWAKLMFVTFGLVAALALRRHLRSHHSWVRCRLAAEFCRSALATWGLPRAAPLLQDLDLVGAGRLTRALYVLHTRSSATRSLPIEEFKPVYLARRIDDQIAYFNRQVDRVAAGLPAPHGGILGRDRARHRLRRELRGDEDARHRGSRLAALDGVRVPADLAAGGGGLADLDHLDQRPAAPRRALPGDAGAARGEPRARSPPA